MNPSVINESGVLIEGITENTPCFVIGHRPAPSTYTEKLLKSTGDPFVVRWFGQELPKGYRSIGVITAGGEIQLAITPPGWDDTKSTSMVFRTFGVGPGGLNAAETLGLLFNEPIEALRAALTAGQLANMPPYRVVMLVKQNFDEITDEELRAVLAEVPQEVRTAILITGDKERQQRVYNALMDVTSR